MLAILSVRNGNNIWKFIKQTANKETILKDDGFLN
jgi:hypothetical protein